MKLIDKKELKRLLKPGEQIEIAICMGMARSCKSIFTYKDKTYEVNNEIDDSYQYFDSFKEMLKETNIGKALEKNALALYN